MTTPFAEIHRAAIKRKGSRRALTALLPEPLSPSLLRRIPDDRWLSAMTRTIFQAGFNSTIIVTRWGNFEQAFAGFDPERWADMSARDVRRLMGDAGIVRNQVKIMSVRDNARLLIALSEEHGSAAKAFASWPVENFADLLLMLKTDGSRLGGLGAQLFLRSIGKDGYVLGPDVVTALLKQGIATSPSAGSMTAIQECFNEWRAQSGLPLSHISKIVACSAGFNHAVDDLQRFTPQL